MHVREAFPVHRKVLVWSWNPEAVVCTVVGELLAPHGVRSSTLYTVATCEAGKDPTGGRSLPPGSRTEKSPSGPTHALRRMGVRRRR